MMDLSKAEDLLARLQQGRAALRLRSVSAGAVDAAFALATELRCAQITNEEVVAAGGAVRRRGGLSVGESLPAAIKQIEQRLLVKAIATEQIRLSTICTHWRWP